jgi:hypothetical protein
LIRVREQETNQVRSVLDQIFAADDNADAVVPIETAENETLFELGLTGLDEAHAALFKKLMAQDHWERSST